MVLNAPASMKKGWKVVVKQDSRDNRQIGMVKTYRKNWCQKSSDSMGSGSKSSLLFANILSRLTFLLSLHAPRLSLRSLDSVVDLLAQIRIRQSVSKCMSSLFSESRSRPEGLSNRTEEPLTHLLQLLSLLACTGVMSGYFFTQGGNSPNGLFPESGSLTTNSLPASTCL